MDLHRHEEAAEDCPDPGWSVARQTRSQQHRRLAKPEGTDETLELRASESQNLFSSGCEIWMARFFGEM